MIPALNMHLEDVRVVLRNEVNDITVCRDVKDPAISYYTMISVKSDAYRKYITEKMNQGLLFAQCRGFVGSFSTGKELKLLFEYRSESPIENMGGIYLYDFVSCRKAAANLISAVAETGVKGQACRLLLHPRNINVNSSGEIALNFFLDFQEYDLEAGDFDDMELLGKTVFGILERPWKEKYQGNVDYYPDVLRLFQMKLQNHSFTSCGQMIAQVRGMPDRPAARQGRFWRIVRKLKELRTLLFQNPARILLTALVAVTILYAAYQIQIRIRAKKAYESNTSYNALEYIGTVYLGDEE